MHRIILGKTSDTESGLTQPSVTDDFDPNILLDNLDKSSPTTSPSKGQHCQEAIALCAKTVLAHLVTHLGHFPMAIGAARLSSLVVEHDDVPNLTSDELSANIFTAPNIQVCIFVINIECNKQVLGSQNKTNPGFFPWVNLKYKLVLVEKTIHLGF